MFDKSIIVKTNQMWKLKLSFLFLLLGAASIIYGFFILSRDFHAGVPALMFGGIVLGLGSLFFGCFSVRCPVCKNRWLWEGISKQSSNNWLAWLLSQSVCPNCKYAVKEEHT